MRVKPPPWLVKSVVKRWLGTLHVHAFGTENLRRAAALSPTRTFIVCHWHQSLLTLLAPHQHLPVATLSSRSRDGDIITSYLTELGIHVIRGSTSRGAVHGAKELITALREGWFVVLNLDGPRGPFKCNKGSTIELARRCGVPILPVATRARREFSFKRSWDRFRVPIPGSSVAVVYGEPIVLAPDKPSPQQLEQHRRQLAQSLHDLEAVATRHVGRNDCYPTHKQLAWLLEPPSASDLES